MNAERETLLAETLKAAASHGKSADALLLALEARRSLRDRIKKSQAKRDTKALDREISDLQTRLDGERDSLIVIRDQFSEKRRSLNQQVLREWFIRSLLVGVIVAVFLSGSCWFITKSPILYGAQTKTSYQTRVPSAPGIFSFFRPQASHQPALLRPGEGCVLRGSAFRFTIQPKSASIPHVITMALKGLPKSKTALKLASILGGNPETMAWAMLQDKYATRLDVPREEWTQLVKQIEEREQMKAEGQEVVELGGLHIIASERHEARRIDLQLRGRCGRQGDPGGRYMVDEVGRPQRQRGHQDDHQAARRSVIGG